MQMAMSTKETGWMTKQIAMAYTHIVMEQGMKVTGFKISNMDKAMKAGLMGRFIRGSMKEGESTVLENSCKYKNKLNFI